MTPSSIPAYVLGTPLVIIGLIALRNPVAAHKVFGVPLAVPKDHSQIAPQYPTGLPFVHAKAIRDISLGLTCLGLQYQQNDGGVTAVLVASTLIGIGDGFIVWEQGGDELRHKAWGHWIGTSLLLLPCVIMRLL